MDLQKIQIKENITPYTLKNKEELLNALWNLKHSWTGRIDAGITNIFIEEAVQMIINAVTIFEQGYFDSAYYSLRQALEIATTMVYLVDIESEERKNKLNDWKCQHKFPMDQKMKNYLSKNGYLFSDMKKNMKSYFEAVEKKRKLYNKYIHKQGFKYFYVYRNNISNRKPNADKEVEKFEEDITFCIGTVAVMRLAIDPFPILLMDDEIFYRTGDTMTVPYSKDFVEKYIGIDVIKQYKNTEIYKSYYNNIIKRERKNIAVTNLIKYQYIDISKLDEILAQVHLLNDNEVAAVKIVQVLPSISNIYCFHGLLCYYTDNQTRRKAKNLSQLDFRNFEKNTVKYNMLYDEAYLSCLKTNEETYFIEHNKKLNRKDIGLIKQLEGELNKVVQK